MNSNNPKRILMVANPDRVLTNLKQDLEKEGMTLILVPSVADAEQEFSKNGLPDGMFIDLQGFEEEGLKFCNEMTRYPGLPVIILGAEGVHEQIALEALNCADSYLRPEEIYPAEIAARLTRLFSRISSAASGLGRKINLTRDVVLDLIGGMVSMAGNDIQLTPTEIALLHVLLAHGNEPVDSVTLIERVWRGASEGNANSLRVHMHRLRRKLGWKKRDQAGLIKTVRNVGYILNIRA